MKLSIYQFCGDIYVHTQNRFLYYGVEQLFRRMSVHCAVHFISVGNSKFVLKESDSDRSIHITDSETDAVVKLLSMTGDMRVIISSRELVKFLSDRRTLLRKAKPVKFTKNQLNFLNKMAITERVNLEIYFPERSVKTVSHYKRLLMREIGFRSDMALFNALRQWRQVR